MADDDADDMPYWCPDCHIMGVEPHKPWCPEKAREDAALYGSDDDEEWDGGEEDDYDD